MNEVVNAGAVYPASAYYIKRVQTKLASGVYLTEPVSCFCCSEKSKPVTTQDRYGLPHKMNLCLNCGLIYANPRMTEESYRRFYEDEYRKIYDDEHSLAGAFDHELAVGQRIKSIVDAYGEKPKTVFEIGCNTGAALLPFKEAGAEVKGVDFAPSNGIPGCKNGIPVQVGGSETLKGKADLIILSHVLEHFLDLGAELHRIRSLLNINGLVYVSVPGLYTWDLKRLFQNAHAWQFTAGTLRYVMESSGFHCLQIDEGITSLWGKGWLDNIRPSDEADNIQDFFAGKRATLAAIPKIRGTNKFPIEERKANIAYATSLNLPSLSDLESREEGREAVIVSGGPSVDKFLSQILTLRCKGAFVISIERMLPWCLNHNIVPDYVVVMDASKDVVEAFDKLPSSTKYLIANQCVPEVFDMLQARQRYIYGTPHKDIDEDFYISVGDLKGAQVNSGASVSLCSLSIAMALGARRFHIFGFDCHVSDGGYAKGIAGVGEQNDLITIRIGERDFRTTYPYLLFAQQFFQLREFGKHDNLWDSAVVYGDSLVNAMKMGDL